MRYLGLFVLIAAIGNGAQFTQGTLRRVGTNQQLVADCPLKRTSVQAEISGMLARVNVVQQFQNSFNETIEAVYVFPLPHDASVDRMTMTIGGRTIKGAIKSREEARALFDAARAQGRTASLLDQERPNIFTQSVTNIPPGETVHITISYIETLQYEAGDYEFVFPMVVGPRYVPNSVPDKSRITPPLVDTRPGHDISVEVNLDAGVALGQIQSKSHTVDVHRIGATKARIKLRDEAVIPNKDFILRYDAAGKTIENALLTHRGQRGGFFTLFVQPPEHALSADVAPKELIFVLDTSGSMMGFPIEKAKETMKLAFDSLRPNDTFNLITFSGDTEILFPAPVPATPENLRIATMFLQSRRGAGGTEMMKAIRAALAGSGTIDRVRIVCFMTDGYVGNDMEIIAEVQKHPEARVFGFGIGQSVNRFLLDRMSLEGRGEVEYVTLKDDANTAVKRFEQRFREPLLTDISIDWGTMPVIDVYPTRIPDLFSAKPVIVSGRYNGPARGMIRLRGKSGGKEIVREIAVNLPAQEPSHDVLATLWARRRVADLVRKDYAGAQRGVMQQSVRDEITKVGLDFGIITQFTSFVAVEERQVTTGGQVRTIEVPVSVPEGVDPRGVMGPGSGAGMGGGVYRIGGGVVGGIVGGAPSRAMIAPPPPPAAQYSVMREAAGFDANPLHPALQKLTTQTTPVAVQVLLRDASEATLKALREAGLVITRAPGKDLQVQGRIAGNKLPVLARIAAVRYIVPLNNRGSAPPPR